MSIADNLKDMETCRSNGYCGACNKYTDALWERFGKRLLVTCESCGTIIIDEKNRYVNNG